MTTTYFTHTKFPAHWLNASPECDWVGFITSVGGVMDEDPTEVSLSRAKEIFKQAVADGILAPMTEEEAAAAHERFYDADVPSLKMCRTDWIQAVADTDEDVETEQAAVEKVAAMIADGRLLPCGADDEGDEE